MGDERRALTDLRAVASNHAPLDSDTARASSLLFDLFDATGEADVLGRHAEAEAGTTRGFLIAHDRSATWAHDGRPELIAAAWEASSLRYQLAWSALPTLSLAQNYVTARGCPAHRIVDSTPFGLPEPDAASAAVENAVRGAPGLTVLDSHTFSAGDSDIVVLVHDAFAHLPYRLLHERWLLDAPTYTVHEGAVDTRAEAHEWLTRWREGDEPSPPDPGPHSLVAAHLLRSNSSPVPPGPSSPPATGPTR